MEPGATIVSANIATVNTTTQAAFALSAVDGTKVVVACFKDAAGNVVSAQDSTVLDEVIDLFVEGSHLRREGPMLRFSSEPSRVFVGGGWLEQHGIPHELFLDRYPADLYAAYGSTRYLLHIHSDEHLAWYLMARP